MKNLFNHVLLNRILVLRYHVRHHHHCVRAVIGLENMLINIGLIHI